jgi:hypothetical protein
MNIFSFFRQLFAKLGLAAPLTFDQQVWGAKSVIDLVQYGSQFLIAQGTAGQSCYTCWLGSRDHIPTAIVVESNGRANSPFPDDSHVKGCEPWTYPPKFTCSQAVSAMVKAGITESWTTCTLKKLTDQTNPNYTFTFATHAPVTVDATTGSII